MTEHHNGRRRRKPPKTRVRATDEEIRGVIEDLRRDRDDLGALPNAVLESRAEGLGIGASTLRRYLAEGVPSVAREPRGYVPSERALEEFWHNQGSVAATHRALLGTEPGLPGLRSFERAIGRTLTLAEREDARAGRKSSRNMQIYLQRSEARANGTFETDLYELPVPVRGPRGTAVFLWLVVFIDCFSRAIMGWAIGQKDHGLVLAAMGDAIRRRSVDDPLRGLPSVLRPDNGMEFTADSVREAAINLGVQVAPTQPFSPNQKGKVERFFRTLDQECLLGEPLHRDAPKSSTGRPYLHPDDFEPIEDTLLIAKVEAYIDHYNWQRPHSGIDGKVPGPYWLERVTDLREPSEAQVRRFLLDGAWRKVTKKGVRHDNLFFVAPEINKLVGRWVEVRVYPHDDRKVEIYVDERWCCTAWPSNAASPELQAAVYEARREDHSRARRLRTKTNRRQRSRLKPRTKAEPAETTTRLNADAAAREVRAAKPPAQRRGLPTSLGLSDQVNKHHRKGK